MLQVLGPIRVPPTSSPSRTPRPRANPSAPPPSHPSPPQDENGRPVFLLAMLPGLGEHFIGPAIGSGSLGSTPYRAAP